jgi:inhibitor of KinA sporulation pathway (predicted exonuclease)
LDYIVLDIEFNGRKFASELPMEVIEIGAVRLNESLEQVDTFTAFIKPIYFTKLNSFIQKKTGIPQVEIDRAERFPTVIEDFRQWLAASPQPLFITWGKEDMKRIILDTRMHKLSDHYWMTTPYFDLLKGFTAFKGLSNDISVEGAIEMLQLDSTGQAHRALDDAIMTTEIFRAIFSDLNFAQQQYYVDMYTNARERRALKNAVRLLRAQKLAPTWENYANKFIKDKAEGVDPRKLAEMQQYFEKEAAKPVKVKPPVAEQPLPSEEQS